MEGEEEPPICFCLTHIEVEPFKNIPKPFPLLLPMFPYIRLYTDFHEATCQELRDISTTNA